MAEGAGIEAVETVAWFHRLFLHRAAERYGLARVPRGLPAEEARALERLAVALDDLRSTVEEGYGTAINALMGRQAEIRPLSPNRRGRDEEEEETERETRSA